jgi:hypothetical protein
MFLKIYLAQNESGKTKISMYFKSNISKVQGFNKTMQLRKKFGSYDNKKMLKFNQFCLKDLN